jgi:hypothetical protein
MASTFLIQNDRSQQNNKRNECDERKLMEQEANVQIYRQSFDIGIEGTLDGLQEVQQVLNLLKAEYFSVPTSNITPEAKLKLQRTSHHCNRLMAEVIHLLQPFSSELQIFFSEEILAATSKANIAVEEVTESRS